MGLWDAIGLGKKAGAEAPAPSRAKKGAAPHRGAAAWAPVIDASACRGGGSCLDACPHGVFSMGRHDKHARVARPGDCVATCDACARACPEEGITFPGRTKA